MLALLTRINKNLVLAIPVAMVLGFGFGLVAPVGWLKSLIVPLTFLMVYPMMVNLKLQKVLEGGDLKAQALAQAINFAVIPFVAFGLGKIFFADQPWYALGLLLAALLPTSGMTISWTGFANGNLGAAVKMTVLGLILGSLATPFYVRWLMGAEVPVDMAAIFMQIVIIVFLPMAAGHFTQKWLLGRYGQAEYQKNWAPRFPPFSTLGVLAIVFVALALAFVIYAIASDSRWALTFSHVAGGGMWTAVDLYVGLIVGPIVGGMSLPARAEFSAKFMPKMLLLMPTVVMMTLAAGFQLAMNLGTLYPANSTQNWLIVSMVVVGIMAVVALGVLEPANVAVLFEMKKPQPDGEVIGRLMMRFVYTAGITGVMQIATLVIMTRVASL